MTEETIFECGIRARDFGPVQATLFEELAHSPRLNTIEGAAEPGAIEHGHLNDAIEWMRSKEVDYRIVVAEDHPETERVAEWLSRRGFVPGLARTKYVREATPPHLPILPGVEVLELTELPDGEGISHMLPTGLELPGLSGTLFFALPCMEDWHCYVALLDDDPVACAAMLVDGEIAGLGIETTLERARRNGCHQALLTRRLLDAIVVGCELVVTELTEREASTPAQRNLLCAGFEPVQGSRYWERPDVNRYM